MRRYFQNKETTLCRLARTDQVAG